MTYVWPANSNKLHCKKTLWKLPQWHIGHTCIGHHHFKLSTLEWHIKLSPCHHASTSLNQSLCWSSLLQYFMLWYTSISGNHFCILLWHCGLQTLLPPDTSLLLRSDKIYYQLCHCLVDTRQGHHAHSAQWRKIVKTCEIAASSAKKISCRS